ncbi:MAG: prolyl oligopeptidase family serine peptidase, partial [Thermomicrobiales bacterium]
DGTIGETRQLTDVSRDHAALLWSPDGRKLGTIRKSRIGLQRQLVIIDIESGAETAVSSTDRVVSAWIWASDGSGIVMFYSPHPEIDGDFFLIDLETVSERQLTDGIQWSLDHSRTSMAWIDATHLIVSGYERARSGLCVLDIESGHLELVRLDDAFNVGISASTGASTIVQQHNSANATAELIAIDLGTMSQTCLTHLNDRLYATRFPGTIDEFITDHEGHPVSWLLKRPHTFDAGKRYLVVFEIHGGPHIFRGFDIEVSNQLLLDARYLVICPNPRESVSFGRDYAKAVVGDWGGGDWRDILAFADAVSALPFVDGNRIGIYGYSYGGYMASWAIGQTDRFRAAVIDAPITDLIARDGTSDIGFAAPKLEYGGEFPELYDRLVAQSPVTHVHNAVTPRLILHPEDDQRCPIGQSERLFVGLRRAGVETTFVRYPGSSHLMPWYGPPEYRIDYYTRIVDWFDRHM